MIKIIYFSFYLYKLEPILLKCQGKLGRSIICHDTQRIKSYRMNENNDNLNAFFQKKKISERRTKYYVGWLNSLLDYYREYG